MSAQFWKGKRVLVTGHTGFKGSWLTMILHAFGAQVFGFSDQVKDGWLFDIAKLQNICDHMIGDINDAEQLAARVAEVNPDVVFHLAAQPLVSEGYQFPLQTLETNILGTAKLLDNFKNWPTHIALVIVSSDKCYLPRAGALPFVETDPLGGYDPYSSSKAGCELVVETYNASFFAAESHIGLASARAGNVVGGGDYAENRIIPDIITAAFANEHVTLRAPHAVRPWQHVMEALSGYLLLAEKLYAEPKHYSGAWNFGPREQDMCAVGELVKMCYQKLGQVYQPNITQADFKETDILKLNSDKAINQLGWYPRWTLDETLSNVLNWYRDVANAHEPLKVTRSQIDRYFEIKDGLVE